MITFHNYPSMTKLQPNKRYITKHITNTNPLDQTLWKVLNSYLSKFRILDWPKSIHIYKNSWPIDPKELLNDGVDAAILNASPSSLIWHTLPHHHHGTRSRRVHSFGQSCSSSSSGEFPPPSHCKVARRQARHGRNHASIHTSRWWRENLFPSPPTLHERTHHSVQRHASIWSKRSPAGLSHFVAYFLSS